MRLIERIVEYATVGETKPAGLRLDHIEAGSEMMRELVDDLRELTAVDLGPGTPDRIKYKGVNIVHDRNTGTRRIDAHWTQIMTGPGGPLSL